MKTKANTILFFLIIWSLYAKSQSNLLIITDNCSTCINKTITTFDEEKGGNIKPAILLDNYGTPTLLSIDDLIINESCFPVSLLPIDIYRYKLLPGSHIITGCLRPYTGSEYIYYSDKITLELNAEQDKIYRLGEVTYRHLSRWSLIIVDDKDKIVASSIEMSLNEIMREKNRYNENQSIHAINELGTLYKMEEINVNSGLIDKENTKSLNLLLSFISDSSENIRFSTISELSEIKDDTIPMVLMVRFLESKGDEKLILNSALSIVNNNINDDALIEQGLKSQNYLVRKHTVIAIGTLQLKKYVNPLINLLNDTSQQVRYETVRSLGELSDISAIEHLKQLKKVETDLEVKNRIKESIKKLKKIE